jgi:hypothetical protein
MPHCLQFHAFYNFVVVRRQHQSSENLSLLPMICGTCHLSLFCSSSNAPDGIRFQLVIFFYLPRADFGIAHQTSRGRTPRLRF